MDSKSSAGPSSARRPPPPLPPRQSSSGPLSPYNDAPPPYESIAATNALSKGPWSAQDSRTSSTQSLVPSESNVQNKRRKLMLIYIHGFMGNETSFRSFPAHVHHLLTVLLAETHVVHTKVYPRYRSKRNISFARDDFSKWLEPHEDAMTDVVLLGHSMGGLLSAEVVLMPPPAPANRPFKHRILGTINFDVPFLGMHPGVVKSGLASMFVSDEPQQDKWSPELSAVNSNDGASVASGTMSPISPLSSRTDTFWQPGQADPNLNPSFNNDVILPMRKGWQNALHFVNKHSGHVLTATKQLVTSHMEFGGAMANYPELKARYSRIRTLEAEDGNLRRSISKSGQTPARVRFVNYYTASTGRVKKSKPPGGSHSPSANASRTSLSPSAAEESVRGRAQHGTGSVDPQSSRSQSPRISLEEHSDEGIIQKVPAVPISDEEEDWEEAAETLTIDHPSSDHMSSNVESAVLSPSSTISTTASLPPIPDVPLAPAPLDVSYIEDPATRKIVEKEHARAMKAHQKAVKDREKAIKDRAKLLEKQAQKARKDSEKAKQKAESDADKEQQKQQPVELSHSQREELRLAQERERMEAEGRRMRGEPEPEPATQPESANPKAPTPPSSGTPAAEELATSLSRLTTTTSTSQTRSSYSSSPEPQKPAAPKKDRKFCSLPPKDSQGERDPLWVRIFMENVDEVGAHCGLFFVDERYERLVGEVADRVETWAREDSTTLGLNAEDVD